MTLEHKSDIVKIDDSVRAEAKNMYMTHSSHKEICEKLDLNPNTLKQWIRRLGWANERDKGDLEILNEGTLKRASQVNDIIQDGFDVVQRTIMDMKSEGGAIPLEDADRLSRILERLYKLTRVASGKPTDIRQEQSLKATVKLSEQITSRNMRDIDPFRGED